MFISFLLRVICDKFAVVYFFVFLCLILKSIKADTFPGVVSARGKVFVFVSFLLSSSAFFFATKKKWRIFSLCVSRREAFLS